MTTPAFLVDASDLQCTLDGLRAALNKPAPVMAGVAAVTLGHDAQRLGSVLRDLVERLQRYDLEAQRALSGVVSEFRNREQVGHLSEFMGALHDGWRRRILDTLGADKTEVLRTLLGSDVPDLLGVFRKGFDENAHSDVLRWLLDPKLAPGIAPPALAELAKRLDDHDRWTHAVNAAIAQGTVSVRREYTIGREWAGTDCLDRVDLVISGPGFVLAVENKIWSAEHDGQTEGYWRWLSSIDDLRGGLFLSPAGLAASCPSFVPISYLQLLACLLTGPAAGPLRKDEQTILGGYVKTLANHILRTELRLVDSLEAKT